MSVTNLRDFTSQVDGLGELKTVLGADAFCHAERSEASIPTAAS